MIRPHPRRTPEEARAYQARVQEQLTAWVNGISVHNHVDGECCPDFSCCHPELKTPEAKRLEQATAFLSDFALAQ